MLIPQFVAGEHELFGGNESEDIRTMYFIYDSYMLYYKHYRTTYI